MADVSDETFETDVLDRSEQVAVVVDLWAPWCGPCRTLGPSLEAAVASSEGRVELAKVNVDENPRVSASFGVQSIPAVYAIKDRKVVDHFIGALPERAVREFVDKLAPPPSEVDRLVEAGDETSLVHALELEPGNAAAVAAMARLLIDEGRNDDALELLARVPETAEVRRLAAEARTGGSTSSDGEVTAELETLLSSVKGDEDARRRYLDLLEILGADDPRTGEYRRRLTAALF